MNLFDNNPLILQWSVSQLRLLQTHRHLNAQQTHVRAKSELDNVMNHVKYYRPSNAQIGY